MEAWLVDQYIHSHARISDHLLQGFLDLWVRGSNFISSMTRHEREEFPLTGAIAPQSHELMERHYDMPLGLMEGCLGSSMKYSMALWENGARNLEEAQFAMMEDLCKKLRIIDGHTVLDIGCGFGSLAAFILEHFPNCEVVGLNLSQVQSKYIRSQQNNLFSPLASRRFTLIEDDFNHFKADRHFDRIVSVGFFEHIQDLAGALAKVAAALAPDGLCLLHFIVSQGLRASSPSAQKGFIQSYIFPGSTIHDYHAISRNQSHLKIRESWFLNGENYEKTLASWLENFQMHRESIRLKTRLEESMLRLWHLYLRACMAIFRLNEGKSYGNGQYLLEPVRF